jgi:peptidoglycan/xylan/chitin deacetylase (PgdA/CDA1 family)
MSSRSIAASTLFSLITLTLGCGRVVKLTPPGSAPQPSDAGDTVEMQLPPSAVCLPHAGGFDSASLVSATPEAYAASSCQVWTSARPAGVCYDADKTWPGLRDHVAYLTFDDGPIDWTPAILDTLAREKVRATFFVNARGTKGSAGLDGSFVDESGKTVYYRDVLKRTVDEGHVLGNHTRDHSDLGKLTREEIETQFAENERLVNEALVRSGGEARPLTLIRAPFGSPWFSDELDDPDAQEALVGSASMKFGYNVLWNVTSTDAFEWAQGEAPTLRTLHSDSVKRDPTLSYEQKIERIRSAILDHPLVQRGAGIVILMHDTHNSTRDVLPEIIAGLREKGYSFDDLENQVQEQFGRASFELTPGPALTAPCRDQEEESVRSCAKVTGSDIEVCGRFWLAYEELGGAAKLGMPLAAPEQEEFVVQHFEQGRIELHPEWPAPCDAIFVQTGGAR